MFMLSLAEFLKSSLTQWNQFISVEDFQLIACGLKVDY